MPIVVTCTSCSARLKAPDNVAGKKIKCPKCATVLLVPLPQDEPDEPVEERVSERPVAPPPRPRPRLAEHEEARKRAPRHEEEEEDRDRPRRHNRDEDEDRPRSRRWEDEEEDRPRRRKQGEVKRGTMSAQMSLGISALIFGGLGLVFDFIPCVGWVVALPLGVLGLVVGGIGLIMAAARGWQGLAFPIAGSAMSVFAVVGAVLWLTFFAAVGSRVEQERKDQEAAEKLEDKGRSGRAGDFEQQGSLNARSQNEMGIVYFALPYADTPQITFGGEHPELFVATEVTTRHFRWKHKDSSASTAVWKASGEAPARVDGVPITQAGALSAQRLNEEGVVHFVVPYASPPQVEVREFFTVVEVTTTQFRWRHIDNTPSKVNWTARGLKSPAAAGPGWPDALDLAGTIHASTLNEMGLVKFGIPYANPPQVLFSGDLFEVVEVTTTHFRWRHKDRTPTTEDWTARGARGKDR